MTLVPHKRGLLHLFLMKGETAISLAVFTFTSQELEPASPGQINQGDLFPEKVTAVLLLTDSIFASF